MKNQWIPRVVALVVATILSAGLFEQVCAADAEAVAASEARFQAVSSHLDQGGDFYFYLNLEDLIELGVQGLNTMLEPFADEEMIALVGQKVDLADEVLRTAGIYNIASVGMSSKPVSGGGNRVKTFWGIDDFLEQGDLWKVLGGAPSDMPIHTFVPESPSLLRSVNLDVSAGWKWIRTVVGTIGGEEILDQLDEGLAQGEQISGVHPEKLVASLGTSFLTAIYLDSENMISVPTGPQPTTLPAPSVLMAIEVNDSTLRTLLQTQLTNAGMLMSTQMVSGIEFLQMKQPLPTPVPLQIALAQQDGFLLIASTPDLLTRALAAQAGTGRFLESESYARAFEGMPQAINGLAYADASFASALTQLQTAGMQQQLADQPELLAAIREWMKKFSSAKGAAVQVNLPDGILFEASSATSSREQIAGLLTVVPVAMMVAAVPAFHQARAKAVDTACFNNLLMIDAAKQMWALESNLQEGDMPSPDGLEPYLPGGLPICPQGGAYTLGPVGTPPNCSMHGSASDR